MRQYFADRFQTFGAAFVGSILYRVPERVLKINNIDGRYPARIKGDVVVGNLFTRNIHKLGYAKLLRGRPNQLDSFGRIGHRILFHRNLKIPVTDHIQ